jgi:hypothetical protein
VSVAEGFEQFLAGFFGELRVTGALLIGRVGGLELCGEIDDGADLIQITAAVSTDGAVNPHAQALTSDDVPIEVLADLIRKFFTR